MAIIYCFLLNVLTSHHIAATIPAMENAKRKTGNEKLKSQSKSQPNKKPAATKPII